MTKRFGLPLNLQLFSADPAGGGSDPAGGNGGTQDPQPTPQGAEKTFTQAELDAIIKDRLAQAKRKADEKIEAERKEAERKALEEQGKYKEMYEALQEDLKAKDAQLLLTKKEALLVAEGYTKEQATRFVKFLDGETDEDLATAIATLKADIPPKQEPTYVDPAIKGNGAKQDPPAVSAYEEGNALLKRLRGGK